MSFDSETRRLLANVVSACRRLLREDVEEQLRKQYGMYGPERRIVAVSELTMLRSEELERAQALRDLYAHYLANESGSEERRKDAAYSRLVLEIGFTTLNRLVALRMCEERGYVVESVRKGTQSEGLRVYQRLVGHALGSEYDTYRFYLGLVFDELAIDLPPLFDRTSPQSAIFPSEKCLQAVLELLNAPALNELWCEDETIGWVYQYFNDPEERKQMRADSQTPRNSREMAVRNQFFTPRYVVEFLVDTTLGRTWIEMRQGRTALKDRCQYLLQRKDEVFLGPQDRGGGEQVGKPIEELLAEPFAVPRPGDEEAWDHQFDRAWALAHKVHGYRSKQWAEREERQPLFIGLFEDGREPDLEGVSTQDLLESMYLKLRIDRMGNSPDSPDPSQNERLYRVANEVRERFLNSQKEGATKEEILGAAFFVPFRAEKDPRDLKVLDPACGSGHFLLYAYDLLEAIYREAWEHPSEVYGDDIAPKSETTGRSLREDYPDAGELRQAIPGLILARNLYGVDIDPRAAQIAALALWLRAQRAYQELGLRLDQRPMIQRSNIVVAEPMPGEADLKREFIEGLRPYLLGRVVEGVFEAMRLAGEAGVLLRVEQAIAAPLAAARKQWEESREASDSLFPELQKSRAKPLFDVSDIDDDAFWELAEEQILEALRRFADQTESADPQVRRLFAGDAARGFAFIDLCRTRFDAFVMNPPFGEPTKATKPLMETEYQDAKSDVLQAFVERGGEMLIPGGMLGCISSRTPFYLGGSQDFRERVVLRLFRPAIFADLGLGVMDAAMVEAAAYGLRTLTIAEREDLVRELAVDAEALAAAKGGSFSRSDWEKLRELKSVQAKQELAWLVSSGFMRRGEKLSGVKPVPSWSRTSQPIAAFGSTFDDTIGIPFLRAIGEADKATAIGEALREGQGLFLASLRSLRKVPGVPFAYWVSDDVRDLFQKHPPFEAEGRTAKQGLATADDFRFLRLWWEVPAQKLCPPAAHPKEWNGPYCVRPPYKWFPFAKGGSHAPFFSDVHLVINWKRHGAELSAFPQAYIRNSDQYFRTGITWPIKNRFSFKPWPLPLGCIFAHVGPSGFVRDNSPDTLYALQGLLSSRPFTKLAQLMAGWNFEVGVVQLTPVPTPDTDSLRELANLTKGLVGAAFVTRTSDECSRLFGCVPTLSDDSEGSSSQEDLEHLAAKLYDIRIESFAGEAFDQGRGQRQYEAVDCELEPPGTSTVSIAIGTAFGRWRIPVTSDSDRLKSAPDPFAALPTCPPAMLLGPDGLPIDQASPGPVRGIPWDGILVDDPGERQLAEHPADIMVRIRQVFAFSHGGHATTVESDLVQALAVPNLREFIRRPAGFFADHLRRYSRSRRKAPIYWPVSTASLSYTLWLYYPRLGEQTLFKAVESYVRPKLAAIERQRDDVESQLVANAKANAKDRERLADLRSFATELRELQDELLRVAANYHPDLDDGVVINAAPLRKLFRFKPWVAELEQVWKCLEKGDYDWSRMAFHLWPERVRSKCVKDRSLAIAHGLEDICQVPDRTKASPGKRRRKGAPALIQEDER